MAWVTINKAGEEVIYDGFFNERDEDQQMVYSGFRNCIVLPHGTIKKIIGRELTWADEPVKLT